jgi:signal peptide peptidase SppA
MRYSAIVRAVYGSIWAIQPEKLEAIVAFLNLKVSGGTASPEVLAAIRAQNEMAAARMQSLSADKPGSVAVLPLYGIINQRVSGDVSGPSGTSVQQFTQQLRQALADPNVKAIVIDVDSPGGSVSGVDELATEIFNGRKKKKITAVSNCLCASAAYWLASQASEVVASPSSLTGSVGVYQLHEDDSTALENLGVKFTFISAGKYKTEGNSYQPLDDEARAGMQGMVDDFYSLFTKAVGRGRGVAVKSVVNGFGQGRVLTAQDAVKQGLADRVATLDEVLGKFGVKQGVGASATASPAIQSIQNDHIPSAQNSPEEPVVDQDDEAAANPDTGCTCDCEACQAGDCANCSHEACDAEAENCEGCGMASAKKETGDLSKAQAEAQARARSLSLARI